MPEAFGYPDPRGAAVDDPGTCAGLVIGYARPPDHAHRSALELLVDVLA